MVAKLLPVKSQRILCVGRVVEDKGFNLALSPLALLRERFPFAEMVIAGDGVAREQLEAQAQILGSRERVGNTRTFRFS